MIFALANSREGQITEGLTMLHAGQLLPLSFKMYEIALGFDTTKISDYIKKMFRIKVVEN